MGTRAARWGLRALAASWRVRPVGPPLEELLEGRAAVLAFPHGELLPLFLCHAGLGVQVLVSRSRDGDRLSPLLVASGYTVARGSSSRGGAEGLAALEQGLREGRSAALAVDGPRGPAGVAKPGAAALALRTGRPLVVLRAWSRFALRLRTWDRFLVPLPGARVWLQATGVALAPDDRVERVNAAVEALLREVTPGAGSSPCAPERA